MKQYNRYLYVFTLMVIVLLGCTDNNNEIIPDDQSKSDPEETTVVRLQIQDSSLSTYASDTDYPATTGETKINTDLYIYIFNESGQFESFRKESLDPLGNNIWNTGEFIIGKGIKYFYVFVNIADGFIPTPAPNSSRIDFEKTQLTLVHTDLWVGSNGFVMGTLAGIPTRIYGNGSTGDPELIELKIGRLVVKLGVESVTATNPTVSSTLKGEFKWSDTRFGVLNLAKKMYLVGQWEGGFRQQGSQVISPHYYNYSIPTDITPPDPNDYPMMLTGSYYYTMENTNQVPRNENATAFNIRLKYEPVPEELYDIATHSNGATFTDDTKSFYGAEFEDGTKLLYNEDPVGKTHPTLGPVKKSYFYERGQCYYRVPLADHSEEAASARYTSIRNHYYILKINSVKALGTAFYMPIIDPEVPIDNGKELDYSLIVKDWTTINVSGEL